MHDLLVQITYYVPEEIVCGYVPVDTPELYVLAVLIYTDGRLVEAEHGGTAIEVDAPGLANGLTELLVTRTDIRHVTIDHDTPQETTKGIGEFIDALGEAR